MLRDILKLRICQQIAGVGAKTDLSAMIICIGEQHELLGMSHRQVAEQDRIDDRKYRCIRADAERAGEDGDCSETGRFSQNAKRETKDRKCTRLNSSHPSI